MERNAATSDVGKDFRGTTAPINANAPAGVFRRYWRSTEVADIDFLTATYTPAQVNCHFHHGFTISVVEEGVLPLLIKQHRFDVHRGDVLLLGPEVPHGFACTHYDGLCRYKTLTRPLCNLPPWLGKALAREYNSVCVITDCQLWGLFLETVRKAELGEAPDAHFLQELCGNLLSDIANNTLFKFDVKSPHIRLVKKYLDQNYSGNSTIRELSDAVGLSSRHFTRLFKQELGMPPHMYINQLRVNKAREMLGKRRNMAGIAYELGFSDQSHFSKTFRKLTGVSPARYASFPAGAEQFTRKHSPLKKG